MKKPVYATIYNNSQFCVYYPHEGSINNHTISGCGGMEVLKLHITPITPVIDITDIPINTSTLTVKECDINSKISFREYYEMIDFMKTENPYN